MHKIFLKGHKQKYEQDIYDIYDTGNFPRYQ